MTSSSCVNNLLIIDELLVHYWLVICKLLKDCFENICCLLFVIIWLFNNYFVVIVFIHYIPWFNLLFADCSFRFIICCSVFVDSPFKICKFDLLFFFVVAWLLWYGSSLWISALRWFLSKIHPAHDSLLYSKQRPLISCAKAVHVVFQSIGIL